MSLDVCSLASGSNGNCYYIGNGKGAVLIDVGISCKELEKRMHRQELSMESVKAIFISHEHTDHIYGLPSLMKKYKIPVYISSATLANSRLTVERERFYNLTNERITVGNLDVVPFNKVHDAADPYSFTISCSGVYIGVITDIGYACNEVKKHFSQCHAVILESNYDSGMLMKGSYPWHLKKRISGGKGHISNEQALDLYLNHSSSKLSHLFLSHISKNNNCPQLVQELFQSHSTNTEMIVTSRDNETSVYQITNNTNAFQSMYVPAVHQGTFTFE